MEAWPITFWPIVGRKQITRHIRDGFYLKKREEADELFPRIAKRCPRRRLTYGRLAINNLCVDVSIIDRGG